MDETIRKTILDLLARNRVMSLATLRPDGWPQATTVGYSSEDTTLYFLCGAESQKARNLAHDNRVSLTIGEDRMQVLEITGLSIAGHAERIAEPAEAQRVLALIMARYPEQKALDMPMPAPSDVALFRVTPTVISVLDYSKGFGHTDLVVC